MQAALREATDTSEVVIADGATDAVGGVFTRAFGSQPAVVVADEHTFAAAGEAVTEALRSADLEPRDPYVFGGQPALHADYREIEKLVKSLRGHEAIPVAVGSGTLNDITKRAAHECDRGYMNVATAASVDGYTAFGASITRDGFKQTMECRAPRAVVADLQVLVGAPPTMTSAGYADLLAKLPAGADWILADALHVEPIEQKVWSLVQDPLREATGHPAELHAGDLAAMEGLIEGLIMSGLAMQAHSSSRPASGAEHQFSHLWEMEGLGQEPEGDEPPLSHGFKVGLGTVSIAALYEVVLARDFGSLDVQAAVARWPSWDAVESTVRGAFAPELAEAMVQQSRPKYVERSELQSRLQRLRSSWHEVQERVREQLPPAAQLRDQLRAAACPTTPAEVGLEASALRDTYRRAQMIRPRYTVLDLLAETGELEDCVDELFRPGGFWARSLSDR
jgi:glycerol-1-phosphate dehydrogenase [NAD(P)+]